MAILSPRGLHALNPREHDAAESLLEEITYFGTDRIIYDLFSSKS